MTLKNLILILSLNGNLLIFYQYFHLVKKMEELENKYNFLQIQIEYEQKTLFFTTNNLYFYASISVFLLILLVVINNEKNFFFEQLDIYQEDNINILKNIYNNISAEKIEYIFVQFQMVLLHQHKITQDLDFLIKPSFILDKSAYTVAEQLSYLSTL